MRFKMIGLALMLGLTLLLTVIASARSLVVEEASLTGHGRVYEINHGPQDALFISDYDAREVWQVDASGAYTVYSVDSPVLDARPDQDENIWWTDGASTFGRIAVPTNTVTTWDVDPNYALRGLSLDGQGRLWLTHSFGPNLYRFEPSLSAGVLCTYTLPGGGYAEYVIHDQDQDRIWLAAWGEKRLFRLDPEAASNQVTYWQIPETLSFPTGVDLDGAGNLWWADSGLGALARLEPALNLMTVYSLPVGSKPQMITVQADKIWYTEYSASDPNTVGLLDPGAASGVPTNLQMTTTSVTSDCSDLEASSAGTAAVRLGQLSWTSGLAEPTFNQDGWTIYQQAPGYKPHGVAVRDGYLWTAVQGAQRLVRYSLSREAGLGLTVTPSATSAHHGQSIPFTYTVTYTSTDNSPANAVNVQDDHCSPVNFIGGDDGDDQLDVDETWLYGCQRSIPAHSDGETNPTTNTITVTAKDADGQTLPPAEAGSSVTILHREGTLSLLKAGPDLAPHGQVVTFTFTVGYSSPDNSPATNISVTDDPCTPITGPDPAGDDNGNGLLDTDEDWTYTCRFTVPEHQPDEPNPLVNEGTVTGQDLDADAVISGHDQHQLRIIHAIVYIPFIVAPP